MDQKGFNEFQTAIQWVVDEDRQRKAARLRAESYQSPLMHNQRLWASGKILSGVVSIMDRFGYQRDFSAICATSCCVAGNIVVAHGDRLVAPWSGGYEHAVSVEECIDEEDNLYRISQRAAQIAGMSDVEAGRLFHQDNSPETIVRLAKQIAHNHGYTLDVI